MGAGDANASRICSCGGQNVSDQTVPMQVTRVERNEDGPKSANLGY